MYMYYCRKKRWYIVIGMLCCLLCTFNISVSAATTPEIVIDGVVVQEKQTSSVLEACKRLQAQLEVDAANGIYWTYQHKKTNMSFQNALATGNRTTNCARFCQWALREAGLVAQNKGSFSPYKDGGMWWGKNAQADISATCDIYHMGGTKTANQMIESGELRPGDIISYYEIEHVNIYAGDNMWYDAGRIYTQGQNLGTRFNSWYGKNVCGNYHVGYVIRERMPDIVVQDITPDIVIQNVDVKNDILGIERVSSFISLETMWYYFETAVCIFCYFL